MSKQKTIYWTIIASEASHVFCCVLPTLLSVLSLFAGAGGLGLLPGFVFDAHDLMHKYELPMIIISACVLVLGWAMHIYSQKIDCHDTGCHHPPCEETKAKTHWLLIGATALFLMNVMVYMAFHRGDTAQISAPHAAEMHEHDEH